MERSELIEALKSYTPAQLLEVAPELYNAIVEASAKDEEVQEALKKLPTVEQDRDELIEKNKTLSDENKQLKEELEDTKGKLQKFQEAEEKAQWSAKVDELIKESGIDNALVTETFKNQLLESKDEEKIKVLLDDRKGLKSAPEFDNGKEPAEVTEEEKPKMPSDDEIISGVKGQ